ncbi:MAG: alpha-ribazole phosphatase [Blastocatellia bacterium]
MSETDTAPRLRLYLIRHGEIEPAAMGKLIGQTDVALSERGVEQARRLAEKLSSVRLDAVYSSDLRRASRTAEIIAEHNQLSAQPSEVWREINMGMWEGRTLSALNDEEPEQVASLFNDPASFEYPGGESFADFTTRIQGALDQLLLTHPNGEIALVVHGGVCRAIIGGLLEMPMRNWLRLAQDYGCLNVITWYELQPMLELQNFGSGDWLR